VFRPNVKLVLEPGAGARIVDEESQRTLSLTPTEGRILALVVPGATPESLVAAVRGAGIDIEAKQIDALLARLAANGFVDYTPSPEARATQAALLPDDVVPAFRTDLKIAPGEKAGLMLVTDKKRDRSFTLYDFEVHIARLLDGHHTVARVIELAAKIGMPVTPESLGKFIGQMKAYGFIQEGVLAPRASAAAASDTFPARAQWSPEIRELYQSALRQFRAGRPGHALEYLDALLSIRPDTPEAADLKSRVQQHLESGPVMELSFEDLHGVDEPVPELVAASEPLLGGRTLETPKLAPVVATDGIPAKSPLAKTVVTPRLPVPPPAPDPPKPTPLLEPEPLQISIDAPRRSAPVFAPRASAPLPAPRPSTPRPDEPVGTRKTELELSPVPDAPPPSAPSFSRKTEMDLSPVPDVPKPEPSPPLSSAPIWAAPKAPEPEKPRPSAPIFAKPPKAEEPAAPSSSPPKPVEPDRPRPSAPIFAKPPKAEEPPAPASSPPKPVEPERPRPSAPIFAKPRPSPAEPPKTEEPPKPAPEPPPPSAPIFSKVAPTDPSMSPPKPAEAAKPRPSAPIFAKPRPSPAAPPKAEEPIPETPVFRPRSESAAPPPVDEPPPPAKPSAPQPRQTEELPLPKSSAPVLTPKTDEPRSSPPVLRPADEPPRPSAPRKTTELPSPEPSVTVSDELAAEKTHVGEPPKPEEGSPLEARETALLPQERTQITAPPERPAVTEPDLPAAPPAPRRSRPSAQPPADVIPAPRASKPDSPVRVRRSQPAVPKVEEPAPKRTGLYAGIGGAVVLALLAFPIPATSRIDVQLVATPKAAPKFPAGAFGKLEVQSGARVEEGAVIATLDVTKQKAEKEELTKTIARLEQAAQRALARSNPAAIAKAKQNVAKAKTELAKAKAGVAKARDRAKAELDVARREAALERAERYLVAVDGTEKARQLKLEATATRERAAKLQQQIDRAVVTAPATGVFELDALPPAGANFDEGTEFGRIVAPVLLVQGAPEDATDAVLISGENRIPLFSVDRKPEGLTVPFERGLKPGPAVLEVPKGYRPWPIALLSR